MRVEPPSGARAGGTRPEFASLRESDLPEAAELLAGEGWTFTPQELGRLLATAPGLSPVRREGGAIVAVLTVARHGALAWIGNVAVAPGHRGKGLGEALVQDALRRIDGAGIPATGLCSVPKAVRLYQRQGFRAAGAMQTFATHHDRPTHRPREAELLFPENLDEVAVLDRAVVGADRRALLGMLLRDYPDTGVAVRGAGDALEGFAFLKAGQRGSEVGPVVLARPDRALAGLLLDGALGFRLRDDAAALECTTSAGHPFMAALLQERGFAERATPTLMYRGPPPATDWARAAALAGLEKG